MFYMFHTCFCFWCQAAAATQPGPKRSGLCCRGVSARDEAAKRRADPHEDGDLLDEDSLWLKNGIANK